MNLLLLLGLLLAQLPCADSATVLFAGDAMQHERQLKAAKTDDGYDYAPCFQGLKPLVEQADYAVVNLETPLGGAPYSGYPKFCAPDTYLDALVGIGFDLFLGANNHALDRSDAGVARTITQFDQRHLPYVGIYRTQAERDSVLPRIVDVNGFKIAFLNYTYGINGFTPKPPTRIDCIDRRLMAADIKAARQAGAELIAVCVHWGLEYKLQPNQSQRELADWLHSQGVEMVIGSHPHVVQPMEMTMSDDVAQNKLTVFSLGNFISGMRTPDTRGGAVVRVTLKRDMSGRPYLAGADHSLVFVDPANFHIHQPESPDITSQGRAKAADWARRAREVFSHNISVPELKP